MRKDTRQVEQQAAVEAALAADREAALRDVFAGAVMSGMVASAPAVDRTKVDKVVWARVAYSFADAMLQVRDDSPMDNAAFLRAALGQY